MAETQEQIVPAKKSRVCGVCSLPIHGQFVRAINSHFHMECFKCEDCKKIVAEKFFPVTKDNKTAVYCETDYFRRLDLLCARCHLALRGPYIRVNKQKYHMEHFSCVECNTVFKQHDSYYEKDNQVYCGLHYSVLHASRCGGCGCAVLKNFVETTKGALPILILDNQLTQWHPCCYMLSKLWSIKLITLQQDDSKSLDAQGFPLINLVQVKRQHETVEKVEMILQTLSAFEESAAACISEMLVQFTNEGGISAAVYAKRLIVHVEILFNTLERIDSKLNALNDKQSLCKSKEPRHLTKKIIAFFGTLSEKSAKGNETATKDIINLVTVLAHVLKITIKHALSGALRLEQVHNDEKALQAFLLDLQHPINDEELTLSMKKASLSVTDNNCIICETILEEECIVASDNSTKCHEKCFNCAICNIILKEQLDKSCIQDRKPFCLEHCKAELPYLKVGKLSLMKQYTALLHSSLFNLFAVLHFDGNNNIPTLEAEVKESDQNSDLLQIPREEVFFDDRESDTDEKAANPKRLSDYSNRWTVTQEGDDKDPFLTDITGLSLLVTRQLAALALHKHLSKWFSLEKLLQIADGPKKSLWSKMLQFGKTPRKIDKTFGTPLDLLDEYYGVSSTFGMGLSALKIPIIVQECIATLKRSDLSTEGIFRKNGNIRRLKEQCEEIDSDPRHINLAKDNAIQIAALLKKFLRDLPEPLLTNNLYDLFMCVIKLEKQEERETVLQLILCLLPKANIDLLSVLVRFFVQVSTYSSPEGDSGNKMNLDNLATVIAPNILYTKASVPENSAAVIEIVRLIFTHHQSLFKIPPVILEGLMSNQDDPVKFEFMKTTGTISKRYENNRDTKGTKQATLGKDFEEGIEVKKQL